MKCIVEVWSNEVIMSINLSRDMYGMYVWYPSSRGKQAWGNGLQAQQGTGGTRTTSTLPPIFGGIK